MNFLLDGLPGNGVEEDDLSQEIPVFLNSPRVGDFAEEEVVKAAGFKDLRQLSL